MLNFDLSYKINQDAIYMCYYMQYFYEI